MALILYGSPEHVALLWTETGNLIGLWHFSWEILSIKYNEVPMSESEKISFTKGSRKKTVFFSGPATKALPPHPPRA